MDTIVVSCNFCGADMDWLPGAGEDKICDDCKTKRQDYLAKLTD